MTNWKPIDTRPTDESKPFLVKTPGNETCDSLVLQVSNFEGQMYPDHMGCCIDWGDRVTNATHWMPIP